GVGPDIFEQENGSLRSAARPLSAVRDAQALRDAFDTLARDRAEEIPEPVREAVREGLRAHQGEVIEQVFEREGAAGQASDRLRSALERLQNLDVSPSRWATLRDALKQIYRKGRRAQRAASAEPSDEALHEWRKRAKDLWHALEVLTPAW